jgi:hypothetical protein
MIVSRHIAQVLASTCISICAGAPAFCQVQGMQTFENRLEGTNVHPNALQDFTLIAVHRDFQPFKENSTLRVRFFLPGVPADRDRKVFVEALELLDSFHYSMQAKNSNAWKDGAWNIFGPWPTKDVIDRLSVQAMNVGVLAGYRVGNNPPVYLPVDVYAKDGQPTVRTYTFHFITGQDLQALDVTVTNAAGAVMNVAKAAAQVQNKLCRELQAVRGGKHGVVSAGHVIATGWRIPRQAGGPYTWKPDPNVSGHCHFSSSVENHGC